jgi:hypothetical protein
VLARTVWNDLPGSPIELPIDEVDSLFALDRAAPVVKAATAATAKKQGPTTIIDPGRAHSVGECAGREVDLPV